MMKAVPRKINRPEKWLSRRLDGQVTIFMALLFMIVLSLLVAQYRSALFYARRADAERAAALSVSSLLAEYQRPLRDYYHILSVDGGFGKGVFQEELLEERLQSVFAENLQISPGINAAESIHMDEPVFTMLIDGDWDFFLREISLNQADALLSDGIEYILEQWRSKKDEEMQDLSQKQMEAEAAARAEAEKQPPSDAQPPNDAQPSNEAQSTNENWPSNGSQPSPGTQNETEVQPPPEPVTDPRDFVMEIWNQGILAAACPENFEVSQKSCGMTDVSFPEAGRCIQETIDFKSAASIQTMMGKWDDILEPDLGIRELLEDGAVQMYIMDVFQNAVWKENPVEHERVLNYEVEYIISGNDSDSENLKTVLWKLLAFRTVMNLSYILMSSEKSLQAEERAALLSAALLIPQFVKVVAFLLKSAWAFAEALSDCRTLLKGGKVPMMKNDETWYLSWEQMTRLDGNILDGNSGEEGTDYKGYLQMLLLLTKRDTKYRRMTHLMEKNIRLLPDYSDFRISHCIYGVQAAFYYESGFGVEGRVQTALSY